MTKPGFVYTLSIPMSDGLSIAQAAKELGVSTRTVRRFIKSEKIRAVLVTGSFGKEYRIAELPVGLPKKKPEDNTPVQSFVQTPVQSSVQSLSQMMDMIRELQEKNLALAAQLGAATERVRNLEREVVALSAGRREPWWRRFFGRKG